MKVSISYDVNKVDDQSAAEYLRQCTAYLNDTDLMLLWFNKYIVNTINELINESFYFVNPEIIYDLDRRGLASLRYSVNLHFSEFVLDLGDDVVEVLTDLKVRGEGVQELHVVELVDDVVLEGLLDETHADLLLTLGGFADDLHAVLVELDDTLHHTNGLG